MEGWIRNRFHQKFGVRGRVTSVAGETYEAKLRVLYHLNVHLDETVERSLFWA